MLSFFNTNPLRMLAVSWRSTFCLLSWSNLFSRTSTTCWRLATSCNAMQTPSMHYINSYLNKKVSTVGRYWVKQPKNWIPLTGFHIYSTVLVMQSWGLPELCIFPQQIMPQKSKIMDKFCELHNNAQYFWLKIFNASI